MAADTNKSAFADLVYTVLVAEKKWPLKEVAKDMGMLYATLHARLHQRVAFSPEEIRALIAAAPDIRFAAYFLEGTPFIAIDGYAEPTDDSPESVHLGATKTVLETADVLRAVEQSLDDNHIDQRDKARIGKEIAEAERALATLRYRLEES